MGRAHIVTTAVVAQTVAAVNAYTCMTFFTVLGKVDAAGRLTVGDNRLGRLIGQGTPGAREVTAVAVGYSIVASTGAIVVHMLGQLQLSC